MRHLQGNSRAQSSLLPPSIDDYISSNHPVRVIDAFVSSLDMVYLGFSKAHTQTTGRKPYHPADLLKLYLYGYQNRTTSSRKLERECHRNLEVMWLLGRLAPDFKTIADFRRDNGKAIHQAGRDFVQFCRLIHTVTGECVAIDGSKFQAAGSKDQAFTREQLLKEQDRVSRRIGRYLEELDQADAQEAEGEVAFDPDALEEALKKLKQRARQLEQAEEVMTQEGLSQYCLTEPDARLMRSGRDGIILGYNLQSAVDMESGLIVHHALITEGGDNRQLLPMSVSVKDVLAVEELHVVADAGYSNGEQLSHCEHRGIKPAVPSNRAVNNQGRGSYYPKRGFRYDEKEDHFICPAGQILPYKTKSTRNRMSLYSREGCSNCSLQSQCTKADCRWVSRHFDEEAFERSEQRLKDNPGLMQKRLSVERPFAILKRHMGLKRMNSRGLSTARSEINLGILSYNLNRMTNKLGVEQLIRVMA